MPNRQPSRPRVSVVIPVYNCAHYIQEALESVFAQTFTDYEVFVVNDGSPDTPELEIVLAPYKERIVYIRQENHGPAAARNAAIRRARGEYVAFLDSDDTWYPQYLSCQISRLEADSLDLIYSDALLFGDSHFDGLTFMQVLPPRGSVTVEGLLTSKCSIITSGTVVRKQTIVELGGFNERHELVEDFDLWLRMAAGGYRMYYQSDVLVRHRLHAGSLAHNPIRMLEKGIAVVDEYRRSLASAEPQWFVEEFVKISQAQIDLERAKQWLRAGNYEQAIDHLQSANRYYKRRKIGLVLLGLRVAPWLVRSLLRIVYKKSIASLRFRLRLLARRCSLASR